MGSSAHSSLADSSLADMAAAILRSPARCGAVRVVAIDGGAAAGKTTLARQLSLVLESATVLHIDDLLNGWDDQFGFTARLHDQVLRPISRGASARYRRYDWKRSRFAALVTPPRMENLVVEGVSAIAACGEFASYRIFVDVDRATRQRRWSLRDGPLDEVALAWLDAEDRFFAESPPLADLIMRG